jgi:hypothetical protein
MAIFPPALLPLAVHLAWWISSRIFEGKTRNVTTGAHAGVTLSLEIVMLLSLTTVKV